MEPRQQIRPRRRHLAGSLFWAALSLGFGWSLFGYWWYTLLTRDQPRPLLRLLLAVLLFCALVLAVTFLWIWHNRRIARRGSRGMAAYYRVPSFQRDALGRELTLPRPEALRAASVVTIATTTHRKTYSADAAAEG